jgi:hypothetical protein
LLALAACGDNAPGGRWMPDAGSYATDWYSPPALDGQALLDAPAASDNNNNNSCPVTDVPSTDPAYQAVCWVVQKGVMDAPGGQFNPNGTFTRAVMAKHLVVLRHGTSFQLSSSGRFTDVPQSDPYYRFIQKLGEDKVTVGCSSDGGKFCPNEPATNAHGASLSVRMKYSTSPFSASQQPYYTDVPATHWGFKTIQRLHEDKAAVPCGAQTYCPDSAITRGKWARVLHSYFSSN